MSFIDDILAARDAANRSEQLAQEYVRRGYEKAAKELRKKIKELKALEKAGKLKSARQQRELAEKILAEVTRIAQEATKAAAAAVTAAKPQVIAAVITDTVYAAESATEAAVSLKATFAQIPKDAIKEMASRPLYGVTPQQSAGRIANSLEDDIRERLLAGLAKGDSVGEIAASLDEVLDAGEAATNRMVRTNLAAASNDALRATYEANEDAIDGYIWDATLDEVVCVRCGILHGTFYPLGSAPPGPPLHPNCRCVLVPHLIEEGEPDDDEYRRARPLLESGERSRVTEKIPASTQFESWLRKQPEDATSQVTGSEIKDQLWRRNKLKFTELATPGLQTLTDKEAVRRALALHPSDPYVKSLAEQLGVSAVSKSTIRKEDIAAIKNASFTLGSRAGAIDSKYRDAVDKAKSKVLARRDAVLKSLK